MVYGLFVLMFFYKIACHMSHVSKLALSQNKQKISLFIIIVLYSKIIIKHSYLIVLKKNIFTNKAVRIF